MSIAERRTPARLYAVGESETEYGGRTFAFTLMGTVWGDFRPDPPVMRVAEGEGQMVHEAWFLCRSGEGMARGGRLNLKGFDWIIASVDEDAAGTVRLRIERVAPLC